MDVRALLASAPATLRSSSGRPRPAYKLAGDLIATHSAERRGDETLSHEGGSIKIEPADADVHGIDAAAIGRSTEQRMAAAARYRPVARSFASATTTKPDATPTSSPPRASNSNSRCPTRSRRRGCARAAA